MGGAAKCATPQNSRRRLGLKTESRVPRVISAAASSLKSGGGNVTPCFDRVPLPLDTVYTVFIVAGLRCVQGLYGPK